MSPYRPSPSALFSTPLYSSVLSAHSHSYRSISSFLALPSFWWKLILVKLSLVIVSVTVRSVDLPSHFRPPLTWVITNLLSLPMNGTENATTWCPGVDQCPISGQKMRKKYPTNTSPPPSPTQRGTAGPDWCISVLVTKQRLASMCHCSFIFSDTAFLFQQRSVTGVFLDVPWRFLSTQMTIP